MRDPYTALLKAKKAALLVHQERLIGKRRTAHVEEVDSILQDAMRPLSILSDQQCEVACHEFVQQLDEKVYARQFSAKTLALLKRLDIGD